MLSRYFVQVSTCSVMSNPCMHAAISMNHHAPMFVLLLLARSIVPNTKKHICFRQYHILIYNWNSSKERKYLIIKLTCTSSSNSSLYSCWTCGYNYRWDVLITPGVKDTLFLGSARGAKEAVDLFTRREFVDGQRAETRKQTHNDLPRFRPPEG